MYGVFGSYTRWAVVFLIIFVLFFLFVPGYGYGYGVGVAPAAVPAALPAALPAEMPTTGVTVSKFHGYNMMAAPYMDYESLESAESS
ncbi:hypothetical protein [Alicyclobacillus macrosporangiidus]|jgi:hypothetical protein|uniref:Uncharacterized protein n=1 Tax=Alicyclobacillus macrosporangiidus TaxID=392015 RepID=A0A1I7KWK5_9BACL|nr:hypothetical protein [Alicyclobacillus macrosporangiidus]SFV01839.1 hypothetical protein SAMN05421543_12043 [Alicyclobacillus macrosporangiidus]